MDRPRIIALILCFFVMGCSAQARYFRNESKARDHLERAEALENSEEYRQAAHEYAVIAEDYPFSSFYKTTVRKAAFLNIRPDDADINVENAIHWLHVYLTFDLTSEDEESTQLLISLLERFNGLQPEFSRLKAENANLLAVTKKQSVKLTNCNQRIKELKIEVAQARDQFKKMKAVDLQMLNKKRLESQNEPVQLPENGTGSGQQTSISVPITLKKSEQSKSGDSIPTKINMDEHAIDNGKNSYLDRNNLGSEKREYYPYTIHVSSYQSGKMAYSVAMKLRKKGLRAFTCLTDVPGKGDYFRIFIGFFKTLKDTRKAVLELEGQADLSPLAAKMPYAIQVATLDSEQECEKLEAELQSKIHLAYRIPDSTSPEKTRVLTGAFRTEKDAAELIKKLQKEGFNAKVVRR